MLFVGCAVQQLVIHPKLVRDSLVFFRKKCKDAKMATVIADFSWYLVKGLSEINNAAVFVPSVDEIVDDGLLVALKNQVVKDDNLLVVHRQVFKWNNLISWRRDGLVTNFEVDSCGKVL